MKEPVIYFHRNGKPGCRFSMDPEKKRQLNRELRDENIRIAEVRGREELVENFQEAIDLGCTPTQIRKKLRGGQHGKKEDE